MPVGQVLAHFPSKLQKNLERNNSSARLLLRAVIIRFGFARLPHFNIRIFIRRLFVVLLMESTKEYLFFASPALYAIKIRWILPEKKASVSN